jgi:FkbM family methyltransferase
MVVPRWLADRLRAPVDRFAVDLVHRTARFADDRLHHAHRLALSDQTGTAVFKVNQTDSTNSLLASQENVHEEWKALGQTERTVEVETRTLDEFCESQGITGIDVLKLEVHGAEDRVLSGARHMVARRAVQVVFLELIVTPAYVGQADPGRIITLLQEAGRSTRATRRARGVPAEVAPKTQKSRARTPCPLVSILERLLRESTTQHAETGQRGAKQRER